MVPRKLCFHVLHTPLWHAAINVDSNIAARYCCCIFPFWRYRPIITPGALWTCTYNVQQFCGNILCHKVHSFLHKKTYINLLSPLTKNTISRGKHQGPFSMSLLRLSLLGICPPLAQTKLTASSPVSCLAKRVVDVRLNGANCEQAARQQKATFVLAQQ